MKKLLTALAVAAAVLLAAQSASAAFCTQKPCNDDGDLVVGTQTWCCADPGAPTVPPSGICGQVDDLIGGCCAGTSCSGCIDGQTVNQGPPPSVSPCGTTAGDACFACGCAVKSGACVGD
jgi:hypothetical protein